MRIEDKFYLGILRRKSGIPDSHVVSVPSVGRIDAVAKYGFTRCIHLGDAAFYHNATFGQVSKNIQNFFLVSDSGTEEKGLRDGSFRDQDFQLKSQYEISQEIFDTIFVSKFFVNQDF